MVNVGENKLRLFKLGTIRELQEELSVSVEATQDFAFKKRAKGTGRMMLPEELRRVEIVIEPSESTQECEGW